MLDLCRMTYMMMKWGYAGIQEPEGCLMLSGQYSHEDEWDDVQMHISWGHFMYTYM